MAFVGKALSEEEAAAYQLQMDMRIRAIVGKLMAVNDAYGSPTMRTAIMDELNRLGRWSKEQTCLSASTPTLPNDLIDYAIQVSSPVSERV